MSIPLRIALSALILCLPACLEVEEEIDVQADGSVEVLVRAHGEAADLAEGHPLPTGAPWVATDPGSAAWLAGGEAPQRGGRDDEVSVAVRARFPTVDELPRWFAPEGTLYRSAGEERLTSLEVLRRGARTVYVFERRLPVKARSDWNANGHITESIPEDVHELLQKGGEIEPHQWRQVVRSVQGAWRDAIGGVAREALLAVYLEGRAELAVDDFEGALAALRGEIESELDETRIRAFVDFLRVAEALEGDAPELPAELDFDQVARSAARRVLPRALADAGLPPEVANAVLERLEWGFSAIDRAVDRSDETLRVRVRLPGRIVGGNYDDLSADGRAEWELEGETAWRDGDLVLRAVSVLE